MYFWCDSGKLRARRLKKFGSRGAYLDFSCDRRISVGPAQNKEAGLRLTSRRFDLAIERRKQSRVPQAAPLFITDVPSARIR